MAMNIRNTRLEHNLHPFHQMFTERVSEAELHISPSSNFACYASVTGHDALICSVTLYSTRKKEYVGGNIIFSCIEKYYHTKPR